MDPQKKEGLLGLYMIGRIALSIVTLPLQLIAYPFVKGYEKLKNKQD